ncbi:MAG: exopolysaccharide biosynthesis polyprenyl glycosylphosphotransferase [Bacteroidota bacterium]
MKKYFALSVFIEFLLLNLTFFIVLTIKRGYGVSFSDNNRLMLLFLYVGFLADTYFIRRKKDNKIHERLGESFFTDISSALLMFGLISTLIYVTKVGYFSRFLIFGTISGFFAVRLVFGQIYLKLLKRWRSQKRFQRRILIIGAGPTAAKAFDYISKNLFLGYVVEGFVDDNPDKDLNLSPVLGGFDDLDSILDKQQYDEVFITLPATMQDEIVNAISVIDRFGTRIRLVADLFYVTPTVLSLEELGQLVLFKLRNYDLDLTFNAFSKRLFDIIFSSMALLMLLPFFPIIALAIMIDSRGPVFYCPVRIGVNGKRFRMFKFRSMVVQKVGANETLSTTKDDPRITRVGAIIRKLSIDELPQFINVLIGDMSIVGPRPHRTWLNDEMKKNIKDYMLRSYFKPGISGWAQVNGYRGTMDTMEHRLQRTKYDIWYFENWSILLDLKIILLTIFGRKANRNVY